MQEDRMDREVTKAELFVRFGHAQGLAQVLGMSHQAVRKWRTPIPVNRARELAVMFPNEFSVTDGGKLCWVPGITPLTNRGQMVPELSTGNPQDTHRLSTDLPTD